MFVITKIIIKLHNDVCNISFIGSNLLIFFLIPSTRQYLMFQIVLFTISTAFVKR